MCSAAVYRFHYYSLICIWTEWILTCAICNLLFLATTERTCGVCHVINAVTLVYPYSLKEILCALHLFNLAIIRNHILVESDYVHRILSYEEISLTVIIYEWASVNKHTVGNYSRSVLRDERMSERVMERTCWRVCHSHSYILRVNGIVEIVLAITLNTVRSPCARLCPFRIFQWLIDNTMICPCLHICGAIYMEIIHKEVCGIILVMTWIKPQSIAKHSC